MKTMILASDAPLWQQALNAMEHEFYSLPAYARICADHERGAAMAFLAHEEDSWLLLPLILHPIDPDLAGTTGLMDAVSPYGYSGPLFRGDEAFLQRAGSALRDELSARGVVSCFVRLHPLQPLLPPVLAELGEVVHRGATVSIDLTLTPEELYRQMCDDVQKDISRALFRGQRVEIEESNWIELDTFVTIYEETMRRRNASPYYFFSRAHFENLHRALGPSLHLCFARLKGEVIGAALLGTGGNVAEGFLLGTREGFLKECPSKTITYFQALWAREQGLRALHLGGGRGGRTDDSLFAFKSRFSPLRHPFYTWHLVLNAAAYRTLVERWQVRCPTSAPGASDHFPQYRTPLVKASDSLAGPAGGIKRPPGA